MISQVDLERWLNPWPIGFKKRRSSSWDLKVMPIARAAELTCIWNLTDRKVDVRATIRWWAHEALRGTSPQEQHYIHSLAKNMVPTMTSLTVVVVHVGGKWTVVDGTHRLIALCLVRLFGFEGLKERTDLRHIGVVYRKERGKALR